MTSPAYRSATGALDGARPAIERLDIAEDPEDVAANLIEAWTSTQAALRTMIGGSALAGQQLIRELRQRELLSLDQAHALVEFNAANERAKRTDYRPTSADVDAARAGFQQLEAALLHAPPRAQNVPSPAAAPAAGTAVPPPSSEAVPPPYAAKPGRIAPLAFILGVLVVLAGVGGLAYYLIEGRSQDGPLERGIAAYRAGDRMRARTEFAEAARDNPKLAAPHIYLGRLAREEGDAGTAGRELTQAITLEPENAVAQREMAAHLLASGNLELARSFYVRAVKLDPTDRTALGYLGCTLIRLGRIDEGLRFVNRAGPGDWSSCANVAPPPMAPPPTQ